jgi:hypothetical protein
LLPAEHIKECFEAYRNPSIREHGNSPASQKDSSIEWGVLEERLGVHDFQTEVVLRGRTLPTVTIDLACGTRIRACSDILLMRTSCPENGKLHPLGKRYF